MKIIAITGGIGSGKSVVSQVLRRMGYEVYDCDSRAKALMNSSNEIKRDLSNAFGADVVGGDGKINSARLAQMVFADGSALMRLNAIVHPRVKTDILRWSGSFARSKPFVFIETAILEESNLGDIIAEVWHVYAPVEVRVKRVMKRNNATESEVKARIASQNEAAEPSPDFIINDGATPVLPQIMSRLEADLGRKKI